MMRNAIGKHPPEQNDPIIRHAIHEDDLVRDARRHWEEDCRRQAAWHLLQAKNLLDAIAEPRCHVGP